MSAGYDEALESVDGRLQQLQETVNALHHDVRSAASPAQPSIGKDSGLPLELSSGWAPHLSPASLGYRGDPSFEVQAGRMAGSHGSPPIHPLLEDCSNIVTISHPSQHLGPGSESRVASTQPGTVPLLDQQPNTTRHPLPPTDPVLKLLRLSQTEKQRFFVDLLILDEQEFADLCREVFFAVNPYTLYTWAIVNVGLFYLFTDLSPSLYSEIGISSNEVDTITGVLAANAQETVNNFRVCSEPSIEGCQALSLLVSRYHANSRHLLLTSAGHILHEIRADHQSLDSNLRRREGVHRSRFPQDATLNHSRRRNCTETQGLLAPVHHGRRPGSHPGQDAVSAPLRHRHRAPGLRH